MAVAHRMLVEVLVMCEQILCKMLLSRVLL